MLVTDETPKAKKGVTWLIVLAVVMALAAVALAVAFAFNSASELHGFAAQDDTEALEEAKSDKPKVTNASTQVINLVGLMGLSETDAVQKIGHGAAVQDEAPMSSVGFTDEETVVLTDEKGDALSGTPTVTLGFERCRCSGIVQRSHFVAGLWQPFLHRCRSEVSYRGKFAGQGRPYRCGRGERDTA